MQCGLVSGNSSGAKSNAAKNIYSEEGQLPTSLGGGMGEKLPAALLALAHIHGTHEWWMCDIHLQLASARAAGWTHCQEVPRLNPAQFC